MDSSGAYLLTCVCNVNNEVILLALYLFIIIIGINIYIGRETTSAFLPLSMLLVNTSVSDWKCSIVRMQLKYTPKEIVSSPSREVW